LLGIVIVLLLYYNMKQYDYMLGNVV